MNSENNTVLQEKTPKNDCSKENATDKFISVAEYSNLGQGDCISYLKQLQDDSVDLVLTDPPYNLGNFMDDRATNLGAMRDNHFSSSDWDKLSHKEWTKNMDTFILESNRILKKSGALLIFMSLMRVETIIQLAQKYKFYYKTTGVWHKTNPMPRNMNLHFVNSTEGWIYFINEDTTGKFNNNGSLVHDFIETSLTSSKEKKFGKHPTQKPLSLMNHFLDLLTDKGDTVLDPFMGSGTTGVACEIKHRNFIGIEFSKDYFHLAKQRIKKTEQYKCE